MRLSIQLEIGQKILPIEYRKVIMSLLKKCLSEFEQGKYYDYFYGSGSKKEFCFALNLGRAKFEKNSIFLESDEITWTISISDNLAALRLQNCLLSQKNKIFAFNENNHFIIKSIKPWPHEKITKDNALFYLASPLCLRVHIREGNKDFYVSSKHPEFSEELKKNLKYQLESKRPSLVPALNDLIIDTSKCSWTVVKHYGQKIEVSKGNITLSASPDLLNFIYQDSLGSRRPAGFGLLELRKQWGSEE